MASGIAVFHAFGIFVRRQFIVTTLLLALFPRRQNVLNSCDSWLIIASWTRSSPISTPRQRYTMVPAVTFKYRAKIKYNHGKPRWIDNANNNDGCDSSLFLKPSKRRQIYLKYCKCENGLDIMFAFILGAHIWMYLQKKTQVFNYCISCLRPMVHVVPSIEIRKSIDRYSEASLLFEYP